LIRPRYVAGPKGAAVDVRRAFKAFAAKLVWSGPRFHARDGPRLRISSVIEGWLRVSGREAVSNVDRKGSVSGVPLDERTGFTVTRRQLRSRFSSFLRKGRRAVVSARAERTPAPIVCQFHLGSPFIL